VQTEGTNVLVADEYTFWHFEQSGPSESTFEEGMIRLSKRFRDEIARSSVPVDFRTLQFLRKSPLAMDLYTWITYRQAVRWHMADPDPLVVPWKALHQQFGANHKQVGAFAHKARKQLKLINTLWPELEYETPRGRLKVFLCPPHVGTKPKKRPGGK
jgi:hypothetical protein